MSQPSKADASRRQLFAKALAAHMRGERQAAERIYQKILRHRPDSFDAVHMLGVIAIETSRAPRGVELLRKAVSLNPAEATAYSNLGYGLYLTGQYEEALATFDKAIELRPDNAGAHTNRGNLLKALNRFEDAIASYDKAIAVQPGDADAHGNRANSLKELRRYEEALVWYEKSLRLDPASPLMHYNQCLVLLLVGQFNLGWRKMEWRKQLQHPIANRAFPRPLWQGKEDIMGKIVLVHWEQGFGDTIHFCRYVKLLRANGAKVILMVQEALVTLIRRMDPAVQVIGPNDVPMTFDYHCPLMSLPLALRTDLATIPSEPRYLWSDEGRQSYWRARLATLEGLKVGLVWAGGMRPEFQHLVDSDRRRSMSLRTYAPLAGIKGVSFVSLQKGLPAESEALTPPPGMVLHDWTAELTDFDDTAALIEGLDLVISVDTAVGHLAAALGKPAWILLRFDACWRWLEDRTDSPWYPSVRLFRQPGVGNWSDVIEDVQSRLRRFVDCAADANP